MTPSQFRQALETLEPSPMAPVWWSSLDPARILAAFPDHADQWGYGLVR